MKSRHIVIALCWELKLYVNSKVNRDENTWYFVYKSHKIRICYQLQCDHGGQWLGKVDYNLVVPMSAQICLGSCKLGRHCKAVWQDFGTKKMQSTTCSRWPPWSLCTYMYVHDTETPPGSTLCLWPQGWMSQRGASSACWIDHGLLWPGDNFWAKVGRCI